MAMLGKKGTGRLPVYNATRRLAIQFAQSTRKAPVNIKRGAIGECEHSIIQIMDSLSFAEAYPTKAEKLTFIRDAKRTLQFVEVRLRTLYDLGYIKARGYSAIMEREDNVMRQLEGWQKALENE